MLIQEYTNNEIDYIVNRIAAEQHMQHRKPI